ncbi:MAG TPA: isopentenyl-diphosphate Delta-isomerase [Puia sp.]|nr:isopentenyl-diphosphate Delta-isomerase [Puia sp.]
MDHEVILVNEQDEPIGTMEKMEAHRKALLHRAFSVFIFNTKGEMLLQQRAKNKYHSGGLWTNACCSHPRPDEEVRAAAARRLQEELGISTHIRKIFDFIYRATFDNGLTEFEFDHVFIGSYDGIISPDKNEVNDYCFKPLDEIQSSLASHPSKYTNWFHIAFPRVIGEVKLQGLTVPV